MDVLWVIAGSVAAAWLVSALLLLGDLGTSILDSRGAADRAATGRFVPERMHEWWWVAPFAALTVVSLGIGVDYAARMLADGRAGVAILVALIVAIGLLAAFFVVMAGTISRKATDYRGLRQHLQDLGPAKVERVVLEGVETELLAIDARHADRGLNNRAWRQVPLLLAGASVIAVLIAVANTGRPDLAWLVAIAAIALMGSIALARAAGAAAAEADRAWHEVHQQQRQEILQLMSALDRKSGRKVAGLGDRVARALQILREQQG